MVKGVTVKPIIITNYDKSQKLPLYKFNLIFLLLLEFKLNT